MAGKSNRIMSPLPLLRGPDPNAVRLGGMSRVGGMGIPNGMGWGVYPSRCPYIVDQSEGWLVWWVAGLGLFLMFTLICFNEDLPLVGDNIFLYNRCYQMFDSLRHFELPFIYYNDLGGIGYGSPIFYGQLTLLPFMPFLGNISVFLKVYYLSCLLLNFFGFRCFMKRFSYYATVMACFYTFSMPFVGLLSGNIPANAFAVGISWFFLAYCVSFFRDGGGFFPVAPLYFLIWQSNFNTTVLATVVCGCICLAYFDWLKLGRYSQLILVVLCFISFDIVNMLCHRGSIALTDAEYMLSVLGEEADCRLTSIHPIGGYLSRLNIDWLDCCTGFMTLPVLLIFAYFVVRYIGMEKKHFQRCALVIGVVTYFGYFIGTCEAWPVVYKATNVFFQFPIRYYVFLFGFVLVILGRVIRPNILVLLVIIFCVVDIFMVNPFVSEPSSNIAYVGHQLGNGEYASSDFVKDLTTYNEYSTAVHSESGVVYEYTNDYNGLTVDCSNNPGGDTITLPKLYYNWYRAHGENRETFKVVSGFSNYCEVDIGDYTGSLILRYYIPFWILPLLAIQILFCGLTVWSVYESVKELWIRRKSRTSLFP